MAKFTADTLQAQYGDDLGRPPLSDAKTPRMLGKALLERSPPLIVSDYVTQGVDQRLPDLTCPRFEGSIFGVPTSCDAGQCRCSAEGPTIEHECSVDRNEHKHEQTCSSQGQVLSTHR